MASENLGIQFNTPPWQWAERLSSGGKSGVIPRWVKPDSKTGSNEVQLGVQHI